MLRPIDRAVHGRHDAVAYMADSTMLRLESAMKEREHQRALLLIGHAALDHWSAPELADHFKTSPTTMKRRISTLVYSGALRRLEGAEHLAADRHRLQNGGRPSARRPTLYGRGADFLQWAGEITEVRRGRIPARAGVRVGRRLKIGNVSLTCAIENPPRVWLQAWESRPFGKAGQVHHRRTIEVDGLTWRVILWEGVNNGFTTATITLANESNPRIDAGQTETAAVQLWEAANRAKDALERTHSMRLLAMHPDRFFERIHSALAVETEVEKWLRSLPLEARRWRTVDGELVWADASDGPLDLESNLPDSHVLPEMERALAWALKDPGALCSIVDSMAAMLEQMNTIEAKLDAIARGD